MPRTRTVPDAARRYPSQTSMVLVLPAPLGPSTAVTCPAAASNDTSFTARRSPYRTVSPETSTAGLDAAVTSTDATALSYDFEVPAPVACGS